MNNFIITTDTTSDLPAAYVEQHQIGMLSLTYTINDTTYSWEHPLPVKEFYDCMRQGSLPTTSQANPEEAAAVFEKIIKVQNADILHIAFSFRFKWKLQQQQGSLRENFPKNTPTGKSSSSILSALLSAKDFWCTKPSP